MKWRGPATLGLLGWLAAWPVLRAGLPTHGDGLNHFYRLVELDWLVRHGVLWPRWLPDLAYGYGSPLFIYYPPLAYYAAELFRLAGLSLAHSLTAVYALALALAAWGACAWGREVLGEAGGLVAGAAYAFAPYLYLDVLARGALPEALALGLLPWLFWAYRRVAAHPRRANVLAAALLLTGLSLTHTLTAFVAGPLVATYTVVLWLGARRSARGNPQDSSHKTQPLTPKPQSPISRPPPAALLLSLAFPLLLSAFFWLPALLETRYVNASQLFIPALDFHNNFLTLGRLLAAPRPFDPKLVFFDFPASLGWPPVALALAGLAGARRAGYSAHVLFAWGAALLLGLLTLPLSVRVWEGLPGLRYIQFPWRLVGPASLMLALAAGAGASTIETRFLSAGGRAARWNRENGFLPALLIAACWLFSLPWTFTAGFSPPADPGVAALAGYERDSGQLGTTSAGEYVPRTVLELPDPDSLAARYAAAPVPNRLNRAALPAGARVVSETGGLQSAQASLASPAAFAATFDWFYFPGWVAEVDGAPAAAGPGGPHGLVTVQVPAGQHTVAIRFGATPLRQNAGVVSWIGLAAVFAWLAVGLRASNKTAQRAPSSRRPRPAGARQQVSDSSSVALAPLALLAGLFLLRALYLDRYPNPFNHTRLAGAAVSGIHAPMLAGFDGQMTYLGLDLRRPEARSGETLDFDLYWQAPAAPLAADYSISAQLVDANGFRFGQADSQHPGGVPTSRWRAGEYAQDHHSLRVLPGTPPGLYSLIVGVYRYDTGAALAVRGANGLPQGIHLTAAEITVTRPARPPTDAELGPANLLNQTLGPLALAGYDLDPGPAGAQAGSPVYLTLYWRVPAATAGLPPLHTRLELTSGGAIILSEQASLGAPGYPVTAWQGGEAVRLPQAVQIPADAPPGPASLQLSLLAETGALVAGPVALANFDIRAPVRSAELPDLARPLQADYGGVIRLLGYDLEPDPARPGAPLRLTLYWQALAPMAQSYTVFTHLLDSRGVIRGQHDGLPVAGSRPTTGWLPGEVLADRHELAVGPDAPPGEYTLEFGWYDAASGQRLPVLGPDGRPGEDRIVITGIRLAPP